MPRLDIQFRQRMAFTKLLLFLLGGVDHCRCDHEPLNALCRIPYCRYYRRPSAITFVCFLRTHSLVEQGNGGGLDKTRRLIGRDFDAGKTGIAILCEGFTG